MFLNEEMTDDDAATMPATSDDTMTEDAAEETSHEEVTEAPVEETSHEEAPAADGSEM